MKYIIIIILFFCCTICTNARQFLDKAAPAQPGTLDPTFGSGGLVYNIASRTFTTTSAIQPDNKIIVGGSIYNESPTLFSLLRYNNDGTRDSSFGINGIASIEMSANQGPVEGWTSVQVQPDGRIVAAGYLLKLDDNNYPPWDADIVVARFNADGTPDASFGNNGVVITNFGEYESCNAMALQADGKIVITGIYSLRGTGYNTNILTLRYNTDGSLDSSFGGKGYVIYNGPNAGADNGNAVAIQEDGKIVIAGDWYVHASCILLRYLPNGDLDNSFGNNGTVLTQVGSTKGQEQSFYAVTIDKEHRIIAAGLALDDSYNDLMSVARYNSDGSPDNSFDGDGQKIISFSPDDYYDAANTVLLLKDERILLAGQSGGDLALACLQPNGAFDSSFGTNGFTVTDFGGDESYKNAVVQSDGKIVVLGSNGTPFLARYNGYDPNKQPLAIRIRRWLQHHGISWQSVQSNNIRYYAVQRSSDGITYKEIAKLSSKTYNYEDATAASADSYYRIAAVSWDGSRTYSNTVLIGEEAQARIYPNPVSNNLQLQGLPANGKTSVSIVDLNGNVRSTATATSTNYSVNTANLSSGSYLLQIQHNGTTTTQPFVKE